MNPSQWEIEHSLLGCIMLCPDLIAEVSEEVTIADFGDIRSRKV